MKKFKLKGRALHKKHVSELVKADRLGQVIYYSAYGFDKTKYRPFDLLTCFIDDVDLL